MLLPYHADDENLRRNSATFPGSVRRWKICGRQLGELAQGQQRAGYPRGETHPDRERGFLSAVPQVLRISKTKRASATSGITKRKSRPRGGGGRKRDIRNPAISAPRRQCLQGASATGLECRSHGILQCQAPGAARNASFTGKSAFTLGRDYDKISSGWTNERSGGGGWLHGCIARRGDVRQHGQNWAQSQ